jgi:hypothetical protein
LVPACEPIVQVVRIVPAGADISVNDRRSRSRFLRSVGRLGETPRLLTIKKRSGNGFPDR